MLGTGITGMIVMMLLGIPLYVCATASVPVAAALIAKGVSPGAALVFLMTGPATNAAAIAIIWQIMGRRSTIIYLSTVAVMAMASGLVLDYVFKLGEFVPKPGSSWMMPGYLKTIFALLLLGVLFYALYKPKREGGVEMEQDETASNVTLLIKGMTCSHCAESAKKALLSAPGVGSVEVDRTTGKALISGHDLDIGYMRRAIEEIGFKVTGEEQK